MYNKNMISGVILTKNEEKHIESCLKSLLWCDERIVVDDCSEDKTKEIAKKLGAIVYEHPLDNDFANQRNFALEKAKGEWVLFLDADERISPSLLSEITSVLHQQASFVYDHVNGFYIPRRDILWGKQLKYGEAGNTKLLRLARKSAGEWRGKVHEVWKVKGKVGVLKNPILHYPHENIEAFLKELNVYTDIRAKELFAKKKKASFLSIITYPKAKFFVNFVLLRGFLDGVPGFITAMLMSFHSFLVRGKLWLLWQKQ